MIKVEVIKSNDQEAVSQYEFGFDEIEIGRALKSDIVIRCDQWKEINFTLRIINDGLKIISNENVENYHSNGKVIAGTKVHKKNDTFSYKQTEIKIIDFKKTTPIFNNFTDDYKKHIEQNPESIELINQIEAEIKSLK